MMNAWEPDLIRPATLADIAEVMRLETSCPTAAHWTEQQYRRLVQTAGDSVERLVLVAEGTPDPAAPSREQAQGAPLAGFLVADRSVSDWELQNIVVAPESRGHGLGMRLLEALLTHAKETNSDSVFLEVRESNAVARALYERAGFRQTGRRKSYYANPVEDAILYSRKLA